MTSWRRVDDQPYIWTPWCAPKCHVCSKTKMPTSILPLQDCDVHMRNLFRVHDAHVTIVCERFIRWKAFHCPPVTSYNPTFNWLVESIHAAPCNSPAAALWLLCDQNHASEQDLPADRLCNLPTIPPEVKHFAENNRMWTLLKLWDDLKRHLDWYTLHKEYLRLIT